MSRNKAVLAVLAAIAVAVPMFFVGRAGGGQEKTTHVRAKQEGRSVVVVGQKSPRVATIRRGSLAGLVSPPRVSASSSGSSSGSSSSSGSTYKPPSDIVGSG